MKKNLPKVYQNHINKKLNNNSKYYSSSEKKVIEELNTKEPKNIRKKINEIFASPNYIYKANVSITLENQTINTRIIGRNKNYLITMDNKTIAIDDIIDIQSK